jgi:TRAP-type C4-dicarboxylate transport system permease small subunit
VSRKLADFEKVVHTLSRGLQRIAGVGLVAMLALIVADIISAKVFKWPIPGGIEIAGFLGVVVVGFSIAQTQVVHGHIEVGFLVERMPGRARKSIGTAVYSCGMALFALLAWQSYELGRRLQLSGEVSMTQEIPFYPFVYGIAICCIAVLLVQAVQLLKVLTNSASR